MLPPKKPGRALASATGRLGFALAAFAVAALPMGLSVGGAHALVSQGASKNENQPPQLGCFAKVNCAFPDYLDIAGREVEAECVANFSPFAVESSSSGGYTDSGTLCGQVTLLNANGSTSSYYCGYDEPGAPCASA